jgi:hypothetical protein
VRSLATVEVTCVISAVFQTVVIFILCLQRGTLVTADLKNKKKISMALVRKRTIPTERPPLVGEVSANFSG